MHPLKDHLSAFTTARWDTAASTGTSTSTNSAKAAFPDRNLAPLPPPLPRSKSQDPFTHDELINSVSKLLTLHGIPWSGIELTFPVGATGMTLSVDVPSDEMAARGLRLMQHDAYIVQRLPKDLAKVEFVELDPGERSFRMGRGE